MSLTFDRVAIVGATGPTGRHLAPLLRSRGMAVRVISRSADHLARAFADQDVERHAASALDPHALVAATTDCDLVIDCIGLPPDRMDDHAVTARNVVQAAAAAGAQCLQVSSFWGFLPARHAVIDETHPRTGGNAFVRARRAAEDVMLQAGAGVAHLPDFFGPHVHTSVLQGPLQEAAAGKPMSWMGSADTEREHGYVPDAMRAVADLVTREEAFGQSWIIPGSGPLSPRRAAAIASEALGREVKLRCAPAWLVKLLSLVNADLRAIRPMIDDYTTPIAYDASKITQLLGPVATTPYEQAIPQTLAQLAARGG